MSIDNEDPLLINSNTLLQLQNPNHSKRRGRPRLHQVKEFTPQPQSLISFFFQEYNNKLNQQYLKKCPENITSVCLDDNVDPQSYCEDDHVSTKCESLKKKPNRSIPEELNKLNSTYYTDTPETKCNREYSPNKTQNIFYKCDYEGCGYLTKISTNLTKHKRIHTKEKPYLCDQCYFRSNFISSLKVHKRIHTREQPFCCERCGYRCNSSSNLKKHILHRH